MGLGRPFRLVPQHPRLSTEAAQGETEPLAWSPAPGTLATREGPDRPRPASSAWFLSWPSGLKPSRSRVSWVLGPRLQKLLCKTAVWGPSRLPDDGRPHEAGSQACRKPSVSSSQCPAGRDAHPARPAPPSRSVGQVWPSWRGTADSPAGQLARCLAFVWDSIWGGQGERSPRTGLSDGGAPSRASQIIARGRWEEWVRKTRKAVLTSHTGTRAGRGVPLIISHVVGQARGRG